MFGVCRIVNVTGVVKFVGPLDDSREKAPTYIGVQLYDNGNRFKYSSYAQQVFERKISLT